MKVLDVIYSDWLNSLNIIVDLHKVHYSGTILDGDKIWRCYL